MVATELSAVQARIVAAARRAGRDSGEITLVAIGKGHPVAKLEEAYRAGQRVFGESRAQELVAKVGSLPGDIVWHFVGPLQRNKARKVRRVVSLLHSMDRPELVREWAKDEPPGPPVLIQVNVGREPQKHGVEPEDAAGLVEAAVAAGLDVRGLMTIPPLAPAPEAARPFFAELAELRERLARRWPVLRELSMGMTDDFEVAVEEGATLVRVGRAIFGERPG